MADFMVLLFSSLFSLDALRPRSGWKPWGLSSPLLSSPLLSSPLLSSPLLSSRAFRDGLEQVTVLQNGDILTARHAQTLQAWLKDLELQGGLGSTSSMRRNHASRPKQRDGDTVENAGVSECREARSKSVELSLQKSAGHFRSLIVLAKASVEVTGSVLSLIASKGRTVHKTSLPTIQIEFQKTITKVDDCKRKGFSQKTPDPHKFDWLSVVSCVFFLLLGFWGVVML